MHLFDVNGQDSEVRTEKTMLLSFTANCGRLAIHLQLFECNNHHLYAMLKRENPFVECEGEQPPLPAAGFAFFSLERTPLLPPPPFRALPRISHDAICHDRPWHQHHAAANAPPAGRSKCIAATETNHESTMLVYLPVAAACCPSKRLLA